MDGLPESLDAVKRIYEKEDLYRKILRLQSAKLGKETTISKTIGKFLLKPLSLLYGKKGCIHKLETLAARHPYDDSKYVGVVTLGLYGLDERMLKEEFEKCEYCTFEGLQFPVFSCWHKYLQGIYGDYMKLPDVSCRKNHHITVNIN